MGLLKNAFFHCSSILSLLVISCSRHFDHLLRQQSLHFHHQQPLHLKIIERFFYKGFFIIYRKFGKRFLLPPPSALDITGKRAVVVLILPPDKSRPLKVTSMVLGGPWRIGYHTSASPTPPSPVAVPPTPPPVLLEAFPVPHSTPPVPPGAFPVPHSPPVLPGTFPVPHSTPPVPPGAFPVPHSPPVPS